ncbi:MAG TPA: hypothetical protein PLN52_07630 [Opitutaceae bacterium]|nr:hypothetical protein [Opitutaceae bacterium]
MKLTIKRRNCGAWLRQSAVRLLGLSVGLLVAQTAHAVLPLPTGATPAPNTAQSTAAFPKRITAQGSNFGVWDSALVVPNYGQAGYYAQTTVDGTNFTGIGGLLEFDAAGNTTTRLSPLQLGVTIFPAPNASQIFAEQTTATELTFGLYQKAGGAAVFQRKLTTDPARTTILPSSALNRIFVVRDLDTTVEVLAFSNDGSLVWGRSLSSTSFISSTPNPTPIVFGIPLADGSILVHVLRMQFSISPPSFGYETTIIKMTSAGAVEWAKRANTNAIFVAIPSQNTTNLYFTGTQLPGLGETESPGTVVAKATSAGNVIWAKRIRGGSGGIISTVAAAGELANEKVLLTGVTAGIQGPTSPANAAVLGILSATGSIEAQTQISFGTVNIAAPQFEGNRIWLGLASGGATDEVRPVYVGLADTSLANIRWKKYKNNMSVVGVSPDYDGDDVVASFFNTVDNAVEAVTFKDDFGASVSSELFTDAVPTISNPGLVATDIAFALTATTVTATPISPTVTTGTPLTFETMTVTETSVGSGGGNPNPTPVSISTQPASVTVAQGASASFSVGLNNPSSLAVTYQWSFNGTPISGATAGSYTIPSAQNANAGTYTVSVTSNGATLVSSPAVLTVTAVTPVTIATQPASLTLTQGSAATFTATINNPSSLSVTYQWRLNGIAIGGATAASYTIPSIQPVNVGYYTLDITSNGATLVTNPAALSIIPSTRPAGAAVLFGRHHAPGDRQCL